MDDKIKKLWEKDDLKSLSAFLNTVDEDQINQYIKKNVTNSSFIAIWSFILKGIIHTDNAGEKRLNFVLTTLKELDCCELPTSRINSIINRICVELPKYETEHLVDLSDFCLESLQRTEQSELRWKDMLPELIGILTERQYVNFNGSEIHGKDFKSQMLNSLLAIQWSPNVVSSIASMFIDIPLSKDEHLKVVNKLVPYMEKLTPQEIPVFVCQLLKLCKKQNSMVLFVKMQNYFSLRIYENAKFQFNLESNSEASSMEFIESNSSLDLLEAENTVLYHIQCCASMCHDSIKEYLNHLTNLTRLPEFVLHPFQLTVLLSISTVPHYEEKVFGIVRSSVVKAYTEQQKITTSCWFREMLIKTCQVDDTFDQVLSLSLQDRDLVLQGLVKFAFVLLNIKPFLGFAVDPILRKQWNLAQMILVKITKRKRNTGAVIVQELCNYILTSSCVMQFTECLSILAKCFPLIFLENQSCVIELLDNLMQISAENGFFILDAIMPVANFSSTVRDHLILLLRKALYSSSIENRQMAVSGFLKLLSILKINQGQLSQSSSSTFSSGHSVMTQLSLNRTSQFSQGAFSNEALCLEIISILRRCFVQKLEVRVQLYDDLYQCVCKNNDLAVPALEVMLVHFTSYYNVDEEKLPPLDFNKTVQLKDVDVSAQESLGKLIHCIGLILSRAEDSTIVSKFTNIMDSVCDRMIQCDVIHFELDDGTDLSDIIPESQIKTLVLKEAVMVYEALISYKINTWTIESENHVEKINSLFQGYNRLIHFSKNIKSKKDSKRKKNDSNVSVQSSDMKSPIQFKLPDSVFNFTTMKRIVQLLYEPSVDWIKGNEANAIKSKKEFHQHALQSLFHSIHRIKHNKMMDVSKKNGIVNDLRDIATIFYNRCIKTLNTFSDFDTTSALLVLECFHQILNYLINNEKQEDVHIFLQKLNNNEDLIETLKVVLKTFQESFEVDDDDADSKKMLLHVINILSLLAGLIPSESSSLSLEFYSWLKEFLLNKTLPSKAVASVFFNIVLDFHVKYKKGLKFFEEIVAGMGQVIGVIGEDEIEENPFAAINELTAHTVFLCLNGAIKSLLDEVDFIIYRIKAQSIIISFPGDENIKRRETLRNKEKDVTCQLCLIVNILAQMCNINIELGTLSEGLLKNIGHLYSTLSSLTKHFISRSTKLNPVFQTARFEMLVKLTGKELSKIINLLITHLETNQKEKVQEEQAKKRDKDSTLKNKVLKDTRLIPKIVYEMEQFSKHVIKLSSKTKIDLAKHTGQGTTRDFRILNFDDVLKKTKSTESPNSSLDNTLNQSSDIVESEEDENPPSKKIKHK